MAHKISDACVSCGACADACLDPDVCIDCGACEDGCPTGAITAE